MSSSSDQQAPSPSPSPSFSKPVVQYIFVRRDLKDWPAGAVAAQAAHASVAAVVESLRKNDPAGQHYTDPSQLGHMTKYVYGVDTKEELEEVKRKWGEKVGEERLYYWVEEPENIPTAMATWPVERTNAVSKVVKSLKVTFL